MYRQTRRTFSPAQESLDIWQRLTRILLAAVAVGVVVLVISFFSPELDRQRALEEENAQLAEIRDGLQRDYLRRKREQLLLQTDPGYLEQFARDRLDLQREGETIIRIDRETGTVEPVELE